MKCIFLLCFFAAWSCFAFGAETSEERDLSAEFGAATGSFVFYDAAHEHWMRFHPEACQIRTSPCSTFKVPNSLISLETGVATGADFALPWNGTRYSIEAWNHDQTLRSAFAVSCVWFYEILAARVGMERMQKFVTAIHYGNMDISSGLPHFWIQGSLTISPDEQVDFLRRLHERKLPFAAKNVDTLLDIMTLSRTNGVVFRGKTGTGNNDQDVTVLGWFIGSVTTPGGDYFFATRLTGGDDPSGRHARKITEGILEKLKILPEAR